MPAAITIGSGKNFDLRAVIEVGHKAGLTIGSIPGSGGRRRSLTIMFGRLKDWRRVATRYDRCPKVFLSAIALAATVLFWLQNNEML